MSSLLGQLLGGLLVLAGASGVLGATNRSANLLNISVVVCIMGLLLTFQFIQEARPHTGRELLSTCTLLAPTGQPN